MMKKVLLLSVLAMCQASFAQDASILFLGNSYTYSSNLPQMVSQLALANGQTIYHDQHTPGGQTLEGHSTNNTTLQKIAERDWDFVVIQEQSQRPSFPPAQVASDVYPYADVLVDSIKSNYECTEPVFFMTWGRRDGDQQNCQFYTPLCTFEGMNARLRQSYTEMAANNDATVAPCGAAWQQLKFENPTFWNGLYNSDGSHPSAWGTYLNACIFYATMFRESPVGLNYYASIGQADAEVLQQLAEDMVIDSLDNWFIGHQDVVSNADFTVNGQVVQFDGTSNNATAHEWDFGDGSSLSNEMNPAHTYGLASTFTVRHVASSNCGADTTYLQVSTSPSSLDESPLDEVQVFVEDDLLTILNLPHSGLNLTVYDVSGKKVLSEQLVGTSVVINHGFIPGFYLIRIDNGKYQSFRKIFLD
jgi:hypothetical protein